MLLQAGVVVVTAKPTSSLSVNASCWDETTDGHTAVRPGSEVFSGDRRAVVVVTCVSGLDARIVLRRKRSDYVGERVIRQPACAVVVGLARIHLVTGDSWITTRAAGAVARVIPRRQEGASRADRKVGLPLRTGSGIGVQFERRAKSRAAVGGADVIHITRVSAGAVLGIDQVNEIVYRSRLTPALVPPVAAAIGKHLGEVTYSGNARSGKWGAGVGVCPSIAPVSGAEDFVGVVVRKAAAAFVHARDVNGPAARRIARDLHVANEIRH